MLLCYWDLVIVVLRLCVFSYSWCLVDSAVGTGSCFVVCGRDGQDRKWWTILDHRRLAPRVENGDGPQEHEKRFANHHEAFRGEKAFVVLFFRQQTSLSFDPRMKKGLVQSPHSWQAIKAVINTSCQSLQTHYSGALAFASATDKQHPSFQLRRSKQTLNVNAWTSIEWVPTGKTEAAQRNPMVLVTACWWDVRAQTTFACLNWL